MKQIKRLCVLGGGTAGLVAAAMIKVRFNFEVDVIKSDKEGIVGVGEGSTEHWRDFCEFVGITQYDLIKEADATLKSGVMFDNWNKNKPYLHAIFGGDVQLVNYNSVFSNLIANNEQITPQHLWENKVSNWYLGRREEWATNQFHFNTYKLNEFLIKHIQTLGVNVITDTIDDVVISENGEIDYLTGEKGKYDYDFYIDATGFKKLLIGKLGAKWKSSSKYLKVNSAFTFQTEAKEDYNAWTLARGMDSGWLFRIPVWGRYGNGYIYDRNHIDRDNAIQEVQTLFGHEIEVGKTFEFDPGWLDKAWINNCVGIGLSSSFMEPLEATSIGTSIQMTFALMSKLANYDQHSIDDFNKTFDSIMVNIRDFVALHYKVNRDDTQFWREASTVELPDTLQQKLELWKYKTPVSEDFRGDSLYCLFGETNYLFVLEGLDLMDRKAIADEYNAMSDLTKQIIQNQVNGWKNTNNTETLTHKQYIEAIRKYW
jgi:hypothetical protein